MATKVIDLNNTKGYQIILNENLIYVSQVFSLSVLVHFFTPVDDSLGEKINFLRKSTNFFINR